MNNGAISREDFEKMTPAERRVAIARDVVKQVEAGKYIASPGIYIRLSVGGGAYGPVCMFANMGEDGQAVVNRAARCYVCGIGAAVCSAARVFDDCDVNDVDAMYGLLRRYFDEAQYRSIEATFERWLPKGEDGNIAPVNMAIVALPDPADRLKAIFQNIVDNNGEFTLT